MVEIGVRKLACSYERLCPNFSFSACILMARRRDFEARGQQHVGLRKMSKFRVSISKNNDSWPSSFSEFDSRDVGRSRKGPRLRSCRESLGK